MLKKISLYKGRKLHCRAKNTFLMEIFEIFLNAIFISPENLKNWVKIHIQVKNYINQLSSSF